MNNALEELQKFLTSYKIQYFTAKEVTWLNQLNKNVVPTRELWENIIPTLQLADEIRREWGLPVRVFSCYRTSFYNQLVGGAPKSQHLQFRAIDIAPADGNIKEFKKVAEKIVAKWRANGCKVGQGQYKSFVHVDVGFQTRDWKG